MPFLNKYDQKRLHTVVYIVNLILFAGLIIAVSQKVALHRDLLPGSGILKFFGVMFLLGLTVTIMRLQMVETTMVSRRMQTIFVVLMWFLLLVFLFYVSIYPALYSFTTSIDIVGSAVIVGMTFWLLEVASSSTIILFKGNQTK